MNKETEKKQKHKRRKLKNSPSTEREKGREKLQRESSRMIL
jgi:hypothetical protein